MMRGLGHDRFNGPGDPPFPRFISPRIPEHLILSALGSDRSLDDLLRNFRCYRIPLIERVIQLVHKRSGSRLKNIDTTISFEATAVYIPHHHSQH